MCYFTYYGTFKYSNMETKNSKRVLLTEEELMGVVGGLVQLANPSSNRTDFFIAKKDCSEYGDWRECKAYNHCKWKLFKRTCVDK